MGQKLPLPHLIELLGFVPQADLVAEVGKAMIASPKGDQLISKDPLELPLATSLRPLARQRGMSCRATIKYKL
jgi:hypothetical protein